MGVRSGGHRGMYALHQDMLCASAGTRSFITSVPALPDLPLFSLKPRFLVTRKGIRGEAQASAYESAYDRRCLPDCPCT